MIYRIDLGDGHSMRYYCWAPDDLPANRERYGVPLPNVEKAGAFVFHSKPDGSPCVGSIQFDIPELARAGLGGARWKVESWEPLTVSPSLACSCGDHGFIRGGRWVRA